ncbi:hypothetical protein D3C87_1495520 [compost metagenome]
MDSADKSSNKAMSAAYKYAMIQAFCIPTEGDNDADAHTHDVAPRQQQRQPAQRGGRQQQTQQVEQPTTAQIDTLKQDLRDAAMAGTAEFTRTWQANKGPVRDIVAADKKLMAQFQNAAGEADKAEGNDTQQRGAA